MLAAEALRQEGMGDLALTLCAMAQARDGGRWGILLSSDVRILEGSRLDLERRGKYRPQ